MRRNKLAHRFLGVPLARNTSRTRGGLKGAASSRGLSTANRSRSAAETLAWCSGRCSQARVVRDAPGSQQFADQGIERRRAADWPGHAAQAFALDADHVGRAFVLIAPAPRAALAQRLPVRFAAKPSSSSPTANHAQAGAQPERRRRVGDPDSSWRRSGRGRSRPALRGQQRQRRQRIIVAHRGQHSPGAPGCACGAPGERCRARGRRHCAPGAGIAQHEAVAAHRPGSRVRAGSRPAPSPGADFRARRAGRRGR
jgi:hypothetical protein